MLKPTPINQQAMYNRILKLVAAAVLLGTASNLQAAYGLFGSNGSFVILNANGGGNTYYHMTPGANAAFQSAVLGTFNPGVGNSLLLNGGELQTFENGGDSVTSPASLFYRLYTTGSPSGSFNSIALTNLSFPGPPGDEKRDFTTANVNLLSGLLNGNYTLEVFSSAAVDWNGQLGGPAEDTIYANNGGSNYTATFSVVPEPSRALFGAAGLFGVFFRRRRK